MIEVEKFYIAQCDCCKKRYEDTRNGVISLKSTPEEAYDIAMNGEDAFHSVGFMRNGRHYTAILCNDCYEKYWDKKNGIFRKDVEVKLDVFGK